MFIIEIVGTKLTHLATLTANAGSNQNRQAGQQNAGYPGNAGGGYPQNSGSGSLSDKLTGSLKTIGADLLLNQFLNKKNK